jgi:REP element-mobilizing transposase RayT
MSHTYVASFVHCVFSTKGRRPVISPETQSRLWSFLGGIARKNGFKAVAIGGTADHAHLLLSLSATMPIAKAIQLLKGGSSKWMNETFPEKFEWQEGYGAFSVGISGVSATVAYINAQAEHHRKRDFQAEFVAFLKKHGIDYDPRYVWG